MQLDRKSTQLPKCLLISRAPARGFLGAPYSLHKALNVARGGGNNLTKHITSQNHRKSYTASFEIQRIIIFFANGRGEIDRLIYVDTMLALFVVKNNEPLGICDGFSKLVSDMFPDSKLA